MYYVFNVYPWYPRRSDIIIHERLQRKSLVFNVPISFAIACCYSIRTRRLSSIHVATISSSVIRLQGLVNFLRPAFHSFAYPCSSIVGYTRCLSGALVYGNYDWWLTAFAEMFDNSRLYFTSHRGEAIYSYVGKLDDEATMYSMP